MPDGKALQHLVRRDYRDVQVRLDSKQMPITGNNSIGARGNSAGNDGVIIGIGSDYGRNCRRAHASRQGRVSQSQHAGVGPRLGQAIAKLETRQDILQFDQKLRRSRERETAQVGGIQQLAWGAVPE